MRKSKSQLRYERQLAEQKRQLRARGIAHPAEPAGHEGLWRVKCEREECLRSFFTEARQRRFCSESCRRKTQAARAKRQSLIESYLLVVCAAEACGSRFMPKRRGHRFCSSNCRLKGYREAGDLRPESCALCGDSLAGKTTRARYCSTKCRVTAARRRRSALAG